MTPALPKDFSNRAPTPEDLQAVFDLIIACDIADSGEADYDLADLQADWAREHFSLTTDARLMHAANGQLAAYGDVWYASELDRVNPNGCVHPSFRRRGLGTFLLLLAEERARENISETPLVMQTIILDPNLGARIQADALRSADAD